MPSLSGTGVANLFTNNASPSVSFNMPATGARRCVIGGVAAFDGGGASITGATYGGTNMTQVATFGAIATGLVRIYVLVNPPTGANNFVVNASSPVDEILLAMGGATDVNQTTPTSAATGSNNGNGTTSGNLTATLSANDWLVGVTYDYSGGVHTITPSGIQIAEREPTGNESGIGLQYNTSSPINWTFNVAVDWFITGIRLIHDGGAPTFAPYRAINANSGVL